MIFEPRIGLEADIEQARKVIMQVLDETENILKRPEPLATVDHISDFGTVFIIRYWVKPAAVARMPILKETLQERIKAGFEKEGINIPLPHMKLVLPSGTKAADLEAQLQPLKPSSTPNLPDTHK